MRYILAGILTALIVCTVGAQEATVKQDISVSAVSEAKTGDVLLRRGSVETVKSGEGLITSKVYSSPQWDMTGKPLVTYDIVTGKIEAKSRYARFIPDEATSKLTVDKQVSVTGVKEFYTVPDNKTTRLSWTVDTDAETVTWDNTGKRLSFYGFGGLYMFESPPPIAWDADKKPVGVTAAYDKGVLTYTIPPGEYKYPVIVDPTVYRIAFVSATSKGLENSSEVSFVASRNGTTGSISSMIIGLSSNGSTLWGTFRGLLRYDTSSITGTITSGNFVGNIRNDPTDDFVLRMVATTDTLASGVVAGSMFNEIKGWAASGAYSVTYLSDDALNTSAYAVGDTLRFSLNAAGIANVNKTGITQAWLLSADDIASNAPGGALSAIMYYSLAPYLEVTTGSGSATTPTRRSPFANDPTPIFRNDPIPIWRR